MAALVRPECSLGPGANWVRAPTSHDQPVESSGLVLVGREEAGRWPLMARTNSGSNYANNMFWTELSSVKHWNI